MFTQKSASKADSENRGCQGDSELSCAASSEADVQKHELFIREIESIDEYWGPTFRSSYHTKQETEKMQFSSEYMYGKKLIGSMAETKAQIVHTDCTENSLRSLWKSIFCILEWFRSWYKQFKFEEEFANSDIYGQLMTIYDSEEHSKFLDKLSSRITSHDRDIERLCNHHHQGFTTSIHHLLTLREHVTRLKNEVTRIDEEVQKSATKVIEKSEELVKARKVSANINVAVETLSACLPVLRTYSKLLEQIQEKRYYPALKTLEQLEHTSLPRVARYRFTDQLRESIPRLRDDIKAASMTEITDFLQEVRRMSPRIGQVAMKQVAKQQQYELDFMGASSSSFLTGTGAITLSICGDDGRKKPTSLNPFETDSPEKKDAETSNIEKNPFLDVGDVDSRNPFVEDDDIAAKNPFFVNGDTSGKLYESEAQCDEEAELSPEDLVDFCPVLRCLHIHTVLGERDQFYGYYRAQRTEQARLALQPPNNMHESVASFRQYVQAVLGFFVVEEQLASIAPGLVDSHDLQASWQLAQGKAVNNIRNQASYITDTEMMLDIKKLLMLFARTLQSYGYSVSNIHELLLEIKDHYNEVLMTKWLQVFREIFDEDNYHPITVDNNQEYHEITQVFPYQDPELEKAAFPKQFPFSLMVPKVYLQVKNYIAACLQFSEDLSLSEASKEDMVRRSTNLLLTRTLSGCLASLIKKPGLGLLQLIQITINTLHLEHANTMLESYVARLTGSSNSSVANTGAVMLGCMSGKGPLALGNLQGKTMFKDIRGEAEEQIYAALKQKLDEFLELANYDWLLVEATGHSSSFVADLIAFLNATFSAFTNLPVRVAGTACMSACQHIARSLLAMLLADNVKQVSLPALEQLNLDVLQCEQFAAGEPVTGLEEGALVMCFAELRQILDLFLSEDWSTYFNEYGRGDARFLRVSPANAAVLVEKLLESEKKGVFSRLKRSDKKKLLETVLKQLRQITSAQHHS